MNNNDFTMKCDCCTHSVPKLRRGFCPECAAIITKISDERIKELWDKRNVQCRSNSMRGLATISSMLMYPNSPPSPKPIGECSACGKE